MNRDNSQGDRAELEDAVRRGLRMYLTRANVINHRAAELTGLGPTDLHCVGLLVLHGPMSAGDLSRHTGLTSSATTAAIDRLERTGFAVREADPADRRRVIVRLDQERVERTIVPLYAGKRGAVADVLARFDDAELATVRDFLQALESTMADHRDRSTECS